MHLAPLLLAFTILEEPAAAPAAKPVRHKLAVLGVRALEVDGSLAALLSEVALTEAGRFKALEVLGESDIATILGHERQQQLLGCQDDSACMAQIAGGVGADYLLVGSVGRVGAQSRIDLKLIEVPKARVLSRIGETILGPREQTIAAVQRGVMELLTPVAGAPALARAGGVSDFDGHYTGVLSCDDIPGMTPGPPRTRISMKIVNSRAEYEREVLRPDSGKPSGVFERGTGPVAPGGELTLTATVAGRLWSYDASYSGRFEGSSARLTGQQLWRLGRRAPFQRPCTVQLTLAGSK